MLHRRSEVLHSSGTKPCRQTGKQGQASRSPVEWPGMDDHVGLARSPLPLLRRLHWDRARGAFERVSSDVSKPIRSSIECGLNRCSPQFREWVLWCGITDCTVQCDAGVAAFGAGGDSRWVGLGRSGRRPEACRSVGSGLAPQGRDQQPGIGGGVGVGRIGVACVTPIAPGSFRGKLVAISSCGCG